MSIRAAFTLTNSCVRRPNTRLKSLFRSYDIAFKQSGRQGAIAPGKGRPAKPETAGEMKPANGGRVTQNPARTHTTTREMIHDTILLRRTAVSPRRLWGSPSVARPHSRPGPAVVGCGGSSPAAACAQVGSPELVRMLQSLDPSRAAAAASAANRGS